MKHFVFYPLHVYIEKFIPSPCLPKLTHINRVDLRYLIIHTWDKINVVHMSFPGQ